MSILPDFFFIPLFSSSSLTCWGNPPYHLSPSVCCFPSNKGTKNRSVFNTHDISGACFLQFYEAKPHCLPLTCAFSTVFSPDLSLIWDIMKEGPYYVRRNYIHCYITKKNHNVSFFLRIFICTTINFFCEQLPPPYFPKMFNNNMTMLHIHQQVW